MKTTRLLFALPLILFACGAETETATTSENNAQISEPEEVVLEEIVEEEIASAEFVFDEKGFKNLDLTAYVNDPDTKGPTNIRSKPNGNVLVPLEKNDEYMVHIVECKDGWFKIDGVEAFENVIDIPGQFGWIHNSVLEAGTRNYGGQAITVYENPTKSAKEVGVCSTETIVRFSKVYQNFALVTFKDAKGNKIEGWMEITWLCGNPATNCS